MTSRSAAQSGASAAAPGRCARCGARLTAADEWCMLCHSPVSGQAELPEQRTEPDSEPGPVPGPEARPGLTDERIDRLLARLAASEAASDPSPQLGALAGLHGRARGFLLAAVLGLVLFAGGMLGLYVLGSLV